MSPRPKARSPRRRPPISVSGSHARRNQKLPEGDIVQTFDGTRAWVKDRMGIHEIPDRMIRDLKRHLQARHGDGAAGGARRHARRASAARRQRQPRHAPAAPWSCRAADLEPVVLNIDAETYLVSSQSCVAGGQGAPLIEEEFSDYQPVDGLQIALCRFGLAVRQESARARASRASASTRRSIRRSSSARRLDPSPDAVVRRAVRRFVRRRAHARAQDTRSGHARLPGSAVRALRQPEVSSSTTTAASP